MLAERDMPTFINSRVVIENRDPANNLEKELGVRSSSFKIIRAYLHYSKKFLKFANNFSDDITRQGIKDYLDYLIRFGRSKTIVYIALFFQENMLKFIYYLKYNKINQKSMKKAIILSLSLMICFGFSACGKKETKIDVQVSAPEGGLIVKENSTLMDWLKKGKAVECRVTSPEGEMIIKTKSEVVRMEGIPYFSPDSSGEQPKAENGVMLTVGDWMYTWDTSTKKGMKMNLKELEAIGQEENKTDNVDMKKWDEMVDEWEDMDVAYECKEVKLDDELFTEPKDIDFMDLSAMMTGMQEGADKLIECLNNSENMNQEDIEKMLEDMNIGGEDLLKE